MQAAVYIRHVSISSNLDGIFSNLHNVGDEALHTLAVSVVQQGASVVACGRRRGEAGELWNRPRRAATITASVRNKLGTGELYNNT